ncbi:MAG: hypothetical protein V1837_03720 [Candidatus Woesearchaeota archaeon]
MKVLFCESTSDISFLLLRKEALQLKRTAECTPCLEAEAKGFVFHLMGTQSEKYIRVKEPVEQYNHYWVMTSDAAYVDLIRSDECSTRYAGASRVKVCVLDES